MKIYINVTNIINRILFSNKFRNIERVSGKNLIIENSGSTKTFITGYKISNPKTSRKIPKINSIEKLIN